MCLGKAETKAKTERPGWQDTAVCNVSGGVWGKQSLMAWGLGETHRFELCLEKAFPTWAVGSEG